MLIISFMPAVAQKNTISCGKDTEYLYLTWRYSVFLQTQFCKSLESRKRLYKSRGGIFTGYTI